MGVGADQARLHWRRVPARIMDLRLCAKLACRRNDGDLLSRCEPGHVLIGASSGPTSTRYLRRERGERPIWIDAVNGRNRRVSPVAADSGDRLLSEPIDGVSRRLRHASVMSAGPLSLTIAD